MIERHALQKESEVEHLLRMAWISQDEDQIRAWMENIFQAETMYTAYVGEQLVSLLQYQPIEMEIQGTRIAASQILLAATHPDFQRKGHFSDLLHAFLEQERANTLCSVCTCACPQLLSPFGYESIGQNKRLWIKTSDLPTGNLKHVHIYEDKDDLYALYEVFIRYFEGCPVYSKEQFQRQIHYAHACKKDILVQKDREKNIRGFAIGQKKSDRFHIETIAYLDSSIFFDLLAYAGQFTDSIVLTLSPDEEVEPLAAFHPSRHAQTSLFHVHDPKIFSRLFPTRSIPALYDTLKKPIWNCM